MDTIPSTDSEYAHRGRETAVTLSQHHSASITLDAEVSVMILCADPVIAAGLAAVLHEDPGFQVIPAAQAGDPDVCAADVVVADYEMAVRLAQSSRQLANKLLVFTNYDSEAKVCRALECGVSGYLLYGVRLPELFESIRSVRRGGVALSPLVAVRVTSRIQGKTLTAREKAVLEQLMHGLSNKAIAKGLNLSVGTVKAHVKSILDKLDADSRTAAVIAAQRRGILP